MSGPWIVAALLSALCCAAAAPDAVPFKTLESGMQSAIEGPREVVVRTAAEWKSACKAQAPDRPCAAIDFSRLTVIGVFLGSRPTAGYSVEIERIDRDGDALVVRYHERKPGPGDMVAQMITAPYRLVTIDRFTGPIRFVRAQ